MSNIFRLGKPRNHPKKSASRSKKMGQFTNTQTVINGIPKQREQAARSYKKYGVVTNG